MICVLRNAMGLLGELAVRAVPKSEAQKIGERLPPEVIADIALVPPMHFPKYRVIDPLVEFSGAVIDDDDVAPAVSADAEHGPAGVRVPPSTPPAGRTAELAHLIATVLEKHEFIWVDDTSPHCYAPANDSICQWFTDTHGWVEHVSKLIAERIDKATPPAPFTFGDLTWAAGVIKAYVALGPTDSETERTQLRDLADRLADAGDVDPNP